MIWSEGSYYGSQFQKRWRLSIRKNKGYLESKLCPNRRIFLFWPPFWIQNCRHSKLKWWPYGAACLTPCKYPFPFKSFYLWIFNNLFWFFLFLYWQPFWNGGHFVLPIPILWAYLVPLDVDVTRNITVQIEVLSEFKIFCTLVTMATAAILTFFTPSNPQDLPHTTVDIPTKFHEAWWKESNFFFNSPFLFPWQLRQSLFNWFQLCWLISFHLMWVLFLSSFINFCSASNPLW